MRLKTIKLSGFKSFVDPTTFHMPSNLIGVVGPNGCGKSNIIDAVRWVMGETSAKLLRGESMADVIFNGSNTRKPVGVAMVELVFDNADGGVAGEYAAYAEIAVKRHVSRDGQSAYFLNGVRCRRRDITDLFLGTGLGPRSYSIIEQGMISRIVEAKPEEIRHHLEEAAGISKYKERRRETENRIRHTRENLERLDDLRAEVDKQLNHLGRQAKQAERYKKLKAEQRHREAELLALKWRELDQELAARAQHLSRMETEMEAEVALLRAAESNIEQARGQQTVAGESVGKVQAELYEVGGDIARIEQDIAHHKELQARQRKEHQEVDGAFREQEEHLALDRVQIQEYETAISDLQPALAEARASERQTGLVAHEADAAMQAWQQAWDAFNTANSAHAQSAEVERTRIEHLDQQLREQGAKLASLAQERSQVDVAATQREIDELAHTLQRHKGQDQVLEQRLVALREQLETATEGNRSVVGVLDELRQEYQRCQGRLSSLEALQEAALGGGDDAAAEWLAARDLLDASRLAQVVNVEPGWESAVEAVLGDFLEAVVEADPMTHVDAMVELGDARVCLVAGQGVDNGMVGPQDGLAAKVTGPAVVTALLDGVYAAADLAQAVALLPGLAAGQSVITPQAEWLGRGWVRVARGDGGASGVIRREAEIVDLRKKVTALSARQEIAERELAEGEQRAATLSRQNEQAQTERNMNQRRVAELSGQLQSRQARAEHLRSRTQQLQTESDALKQRIADDGSAVGDARVRLQTIMDEMVGLENERQRLQGERERLQALRAEAQSAARASQEKAHGLALQLESRTAALQSTRQGVERTHAQIAQLTARRRELTEQIEAAVAPISDREARLRVLLDRRLEVDKRLTEARRNMDQINLRLRELEQQRHEHSQISQEKRSVLEAERLDQQSFKVKLQTLEERLAAQSLTATVLLEGLNDEADVATWMESLQTLENKIRRLEPVNLAAIDEQKELQERKQYLDAQNDDLLRALETLEKAIHKIDRETRSRFKETFDNVNVGVQALFPRLFGGGHGHLELVGEDLLAAGVAIMARPPGKRISSIHLLSGGEKALTAVAFVFAIFQLNPAPFCLLDEVDAPLDDANVGRFSEMVREMSERVQFLFVTHNKITMETAHQLCGVTMREAGVSRLVAVDIAEAAEMVNA